LSAFACSWVNLPNLRDLPLSFDNPQQLISPKSGLVYNSEAKVVNDKTAQRKGWDKLNERFSQPLATGMRQATEKLRWTIAENHDN
jgi:hypothetical protein